MTQISERCRSHPNGGLPVFEVFLFAVRCAHCLGWTLRLETRCETGEAEPEVLREEHVEFGPFDDDATVLEHAVDELRRQFRSLPAGWS